METPDPNIMPNIRVFPTLESLARATGQAIFRVIRQFPDEGYPSSHARPQGEVAVTQLSLEDHSNRWDSEGRYFED